MNLNMYQSIFLFKEKRFVYLSRLILRCRQLARERFAKMRADVLVKLELLDQKHGLFIYLKYFLSFISSSSSISTRYSFSITSFYNCFG